MTPILILVLATALVAAIALLRLYRARRRSRGRVVEMPNSHYAPQLARDSEARHRWQGIALDRIHEINRGEVERLLAKVEAGSVDSLGPSERQFLDHMAHLADRDRRGSADREPPAGADLRYRPA